MPTAETAWPGIRLFAGFGCRRGCPADLLIDLLRSTLEAHALPLRALEGLASIDLKIGEPGLLMLAARLDIPFECFGSLHLAAFEASLSHRSSAAWRHTGCWGIAESAALAMATRACGSAQLLVPRQSAGQATLALACNAPFAR
ncbi:cobalamin biosynthesis protein [Pseudomonas fulva]|nr:cobalamin biosynthesis protein [Pseudomonas fulva]MBF8778292.1 cobalamin biosynthesis protein [Pseudomonas fulva]